jgi:hypothetical protein
VVLGDLNDGPGMDYFEEKFLSHNVTDIIVGSAFAPEQISPTLSTTCRPKRATPPCSRTSCAPELKRLLLDHILLPRADPRRRPA